MTLMSQNFDIIPHRPSHANHTMCNDFMINGKMQDIFLPQNRTTAAAVAGVGQKKQHNDGMSSDDELETGDKADLVTALDPDSSYFGLESHHLLI